MVNNAYILVLGAGDFASGAIRRLKIAGFRVAATELGEPLAIRRGAAFSESIFRGKIEVEGVTAVRSILADFESAIAEGFVPVVVDSDRAMLKIRAWDVLVDGRMTKRKTDTLITDAPVVIGMGPGFTAGVDCHAVVETKNGDDLGRVIYSGPASEYTGVPKENDLDLCGTRTLETDISKLVYFADKGGLFETECDIADSVAEGDVLGYIDGTPVVARACGILRGIMHTNLEICKGAKLIEIDPARRRELCFRVSAKANAMAGGVLEAVFSLLNMNNQKCGGVYENSRHQTA
ncbi:MAG: selenium-dependent molybdenum cofactor biosynthesis protein YqeB [bacterium]|nr:selenium-dependent molybdenum cofactor biosynthesis protein YqeB [bacterium]